MGARRAAVIGTGLIGSSMGLGLRRAGWVVVGYDPDARAVEASLAVGAIDAAAPSLERAFEGVEVAMIAAPVSVVPDLACAALDAGVACVTDAGSVKAPIVAAVEASRSSSSARFIGGHPMAGSEQLGAAGADAELFVGASWVLTPTPTSDPGAFARAREVVSLLGADVLAMTPEHHDELVAVVSHVPHLAATTLVHLAVRSEADRAGILRLAAGGFRDMTRVAAGHPGIWPDICMGNRTAIADALERLTGELSRVRDLVLAGDRDALLAFLEAAQAERRALPPRAAEAGPLVELRMPVPDRPGVLAEVTTLVGRNGTNILDVEIAHSSEGGAGVLVLVVPASGADAVADGLGALGYRVARTPLDA